MNKFIPNEKLQEVLLCTQKLKEMTHEIIMEEIKRKKTKLDYISYISEIIYITFINNLKYIKEIETSFANYYSTIVLKEEKEQENE